MGTDSRFFIPTIAPAEGEEILRMYDFIVRTPRSTILPRIVQFTLEWGTRLGGKLIAWKFLHCTAFQVEQPDGSLLIKWGPSKMRAGKWWRTVTLPTQNIYDMVIEALKEGEIFNRIKPYREWDQRDRMMRFPIQKFNQSAPMRIDVSLRDYPQPEEYEEGAEMIEVDEVQICRAKT